MCSIRTWTIIMTVFFHWMKSIEISYYCPVSIIIILCCMEMSEPSSFPAREQFHTKNSPVSLSQVLYQRWNLDGVFPSFQQKRFTDWNFLQNWCQEFELGLIFESPRTTPYFIKTGAEVDTNCLSHIMLSSVNRSPWWLGRRRRRGQEDGRQHRGIDELLLTDYIKQVHSSLLQV